MTTVIVPLDGSAAAEQAIPHARAIAGPAGRVLLLTCELDGEPVAPRRYLDDCVSRMPGPTEARVTFGRDPAEAIVATVADVPHALVCMTAHGRTAVGAALLGSTAEAVARADRPSRSSSSGPTPCSIRARAAAANLVVGVDSAGTAESVVPVAAAFAARLHLHPWVLEATSPAPYPFVADAEVPSRVRAAGGAGHAVTMFAARQQAAEQKVMVARRAGRRDRPLRPRPARDLRRRRHARPDGCGSVRVRQRRDARRAPQPGPRAGGATVRFADRFDAGRRLATAVHERLHGDVVVLGLPRGGVPVAAQVARVLGAPLDVVCVRKLGVPTHPELAMGAIAEGGVRILDRDLVTRLRISERGVAAVEARERDELARQAARYRGRTPHPSRLTARTVVIVDDGLATGATAQAAGTLGSSCAAPAGSCSPCRSARPSRCDPERLGVDDVVTVMTPPNFGAVGAWYDRFGATTDDEVLDALPGRGPSGPVGRVRRRPLGPAVRSVVSIPAGGVTLDGWLDVPEHVRGPGGVRARQRQQPAQPPQPGGRRRAECPRLRHAALRPAHRVRGRRPAQRVRHRVARRRAAAARARLGRDPFGGRRRPGRAVRCEHRRRRGAASRPPQRTRASTRWCRAVGGPTSPRTRSAPCAARCC